MKIIDLSKMTQGETDVLLGYDFGRRARGEYRLDELDKLKEKVIVALPKELDTVTPSFAQGFFGKSVLQLGGRDEFYAIYDFGDWPDDMRLQIDSGIARALMDRTEIHA